MRRDTTTNETTATQGSPTMTTAKTMTAAQMTWNIKKGFAWADSHDADDSGLGLGETFWTREGEYYWSPMDQVFILIP